MNKELILSMNELSDIVAYKIEDYQDNYFEINSKSIGRFIPKFHSAIVNLGVQYKYGVRSKIKYVLNTSTYLGKYDKKSVKYHYFSIFKTDNGLDEDFFFGFDCYGRVGYIQKATLISVALKKSNVERDLSYLIRAKKSRNGYKEYRII